MSGRTVFLVVSGYYSDYSVRGVFETRELAEECIRLMQQIERYTDDPRIEEWPFCQTPAAMQYVAAVDLERGLPVGQIYQQLNTGDSLVHAGQVTNGRVFGVAFAPDKALKSALDHRARILAEREGIA